MKTLILFLLLLPLCLRLPAQSKHQFNCPSPCPFLHVHDNKKLVTLKTERGEISVAIPSPPAEYVVEWEVSYQTFTSCAPKIDPVTGEPSLFQPAIACMEMVRKDMDKTFSTAAERDAFVDRLKGDSRVSKVTVDGEVVKSASGVGIFSRSIKTPGTAAPGAFIQTLELNPGSPLITLKRSDNQITISDNSENE